MTSYTDILNRPAQEIEAPKPLPTGTYLAVVTGLPVQSNVGEKETPVYDFPIQIIQAMDDVDEDQIKEWSGKSGKELRGANAPRSRFFLTEGAVFMLKDFINACGINTDTNKSLNELINEVPNSKVLISIKHRMYTPQGGEPTVVADIAKYAKVD